MSQVFKFVNAREFDILRLPGAKLLYKEGFQKKGCVSFVYPF
jgi:hypothetical protein